MGKKAKVYEAGDFIFAKVKGYPAWPARVQSYNGKKYFVYFYGTGETANLPPNMIFDYEENKEKFLKKAVKRRDFNEGVKQIEQDFINKTPLDQITAPIAQPPADDTADDSAINETMDTTAPDTTADDTVADTTATTLNDTAVEDSDDPGALVIDEGKQKPRKSTPKTPAKPVKIARAPRAKVQNEESKEEEDGKKEKEEEIVSRSGRKIRPKRYVDEQTEENTTLPSPAAKKRRGPSADKDKAEPAKTSKADFNLVPLCELEDLKELFKPADPEKESIILAYLPTGSYVGIKLFQSRPTSFSDDTTKLQWEKQAACNAIMLKMQMERGQISPQSIQAQLVTDLNLTDEEVAALDKERDFEERKSRVSFLKAEMKLIELDAKIKSCLCLEKADTELCLKLLDEFAELNVRPLMMLKHPTCLETLKRMRAYVGNTPSWDLSETEALSFSKQAHRIRRQADLLYSNLKTLFTPPPGLSFWEFFSERVLQFKRATASLSADELLELVHEPFEMTEPTSHTMKSAIEAANIEEPMDKEEKADSVPIEEEGKEPADADNAKETPKKKQKPPKNTPKKDVAKKEKTQPKEKAVRNAKKEILKDDATDKELNQTDDDKGSGEKEADKESEKSNEADEKEAVSNDGDSQKEDPAKKDAASKKKASSAKSKKAPTPSKPVLKRQSSRKQANDTAEEVQSNEETSNSKDGKDQDDAEITQPENESAVPAADSITVKAAEEPENLENGGETPRVTNGDGDNEDEAVKDKDKTVEADKPAEKQKKEDDEPRAKRSRAETKKTEAAPKSPARTTRKAKN